MKFALLYMEGLGHSETRRGSRWYLDEGCTGVDGVRHGLWRTIDEHGSVFDILFQRRRSCKDLPEQPVE